jgi:hypothetical protein
MSDDVVRADATVDGELTEIWQRYPNEESYLRGVDVVADPTDTFDWLVSVPAREYFRDDPLGRELQQRLEQAMLALPDVITAENASWETWYVTGKASGEALCRACASVLDGLANQMRAAFEYPTE